MIYSYLDLTHTHFDDQEYVLEVCAGLSVSIVKFDNICFNFFLFEQNGL